MQRARGSEPEGAHAEISYAEYVPYLVNRAAMAMVGYAAQDFARFDLTVPKWRVLFLLWDRGRMRFGTIAQLTGIEPPTLSRLIKSMEAQRLISRRRVASDTRSVELRLSPEGNAMFDRLIPIAIEAEKKYLAGISQRDVETIRRTMRRIYENVRASEAARDDPG